MSSIVISGNTSGSVTLSAPDAAGSTTQTLVGVSGTLAPLVSGTAVASTSGTSIDFTGIPSWVKRITVMFAGVSTSGTSVPLIQIGDSGGIENTGYFSSGSASQTAQTGQNLYTTGWGISDASTAAHVRHGMATICHMSNNTWVMNSMIGQSDVARTIYSGGSKSLSDALTQLRITTVNGTDTFDAGTINIMYE